MEKALKILNSAGRLDGLKDLNTDALSEILRRWASDVEVINTMVLVLKKEIHHDGQGCYPAAALPGG